MNASKPLYRYTGMFCVAVVVETEPGKYAVLVGGKGSDAAPSRRAAAFDNLAFTMVYARGLAGGLPQAVTL